jgi:hypothetical protein
MVKGVVKKIYEGGNNRRKKMFKPKNGIKLSWHAYLRILERITSMSFSEAEAFALKEIRRSKVTLTQLLEDGSRGISYINDDIKYIVQNNVIVTVYTIY